MEKSGNASRTNSEAAPFGISSPEHNAIPMQRWRPSGHSIQSKSSRSLEAQFFINFTNLHCDHCLQHAGAILRPRAGLQFHHRICEFGGAFGVEAFYVLLD